MVGDRAPSVAEFNAVIDSFASTGPWSLVDVSTVAGIVREARQNTPTGPLVVKHDYCTHILEVAFPPLDSMTALETMYEDVWDRLRLAAGTVDGSFSECVFLERLPDGFVFAELTPYVERTGRLLGRDLPPKPLAVRHFLAQMVATQVTLEVDVPYLYSHLRGAYSLLYLVPMAFPRPAVVAGREYCSVRPLVYRDSLPGHPLAGIPSVIPTDREGYEALVARIPLALRDYSFLAPRPRDLLEVRIGDPQATFEATENLIALILLVMVAAGEAAVDRDPATAFYAYCEDGTVPDRFSGDLEVLEQTAVRLPEPWRAPLELLAESV